MDSSRLWAWKAINVDFTTRNGFVWPFPTPEGAGVREESNIIVTNHCGCPEVSGDGICLAKNFRGAAQRGDSTHAVLWVSYHSTDVLGEDDDKIRVRACRVHYLLDAHRLIKKYGYGANLRGADLYGANLGGQNLDDLKHRGAIV